MKRLQHAIALLSLALLAGACDLQQIFDERIDDKQLLVLTPDFADTSVQLVFRDPETLAVLDEDFEVTVYANKRLVDLNGNYKNEFIARGGVMEFSVSPEETVSESDPLHLSINSFNPKTNQILMDYTYGIYSKGFHTMVLEPGKEEQPVNDIDPDIFPQKRSDLSKTTQSNLFLRLNGINNPDFVNEKRFTLQNISHFGSSDLKIPIQDTRFRIFDLDYSSQIYVSNYFYSYFLLYDRNPANGYLNAFLDTQMLVDIGGNALNINEIYTFGLLYYRSSDGARVVYTENENREYIGIEYPSKGAAEGNIIIYRGTRAQGSSIPIEVGAVPGIITLTDHTDLNDFIRCTSGVNLTFEGIEAGVKTSIFYSFKSNPDARLINYASINLSDQNRTHNSLKSGLSIGGQFLSKSSNRLEFAENSQYIIEPQVIDLGGEELCGNTYTVRLKRRDTHKKHQLNLSMRNENQNVGLALTFSALLRKQGQDDTAWETVNFKQGSTSVYLEEGSTYEVKLTLADEPFEFTFTNDLSLVEAAVQATLRNVTRIKDINYTINQSADLNTIDAEIVFYEGQSLID